MEVKNNRKSVVTDENKAEAVALRGIWRSVDHPSQTEFGEIYEIGTQSAVSQFLRGEAPLSLKAAKGFAKGLNCNIEDFSPRLAAELADGRQFTSGDKPPQITELQEVVTRLTTSGKMHPNEVDAMIAMLKAREGSDQANKSPGSVGTSAEKNQKSSDAPQMPDFLKKHGSN